MGSPASPVADPYDITEVIEQRKQSKRPCTAPVMGMQSEENEDKLDLAISPKGKSVGGDEGNKLRNPHWRSFGQNLAVSVKDLKLRRELLRKCMTEQEYETTTIGDLASIPMDIAQKYRVSHWGEGAFGVHYHSEALKNLGTKGDTGS